MHFAFWSNFYSKCLQLRYCEFFSACFLRHKNLLDNGVFIQLPLNYLSLSAVQFLSGYLVIQSTSARAPSSHIVSLSRIKRQKRLPCDNGHSQRKRDVHQYTLQSTCERVNFISKGIPLKPILKLAVQPTMCNVYN